MGVEFGKGNPHLLVLYHTLIETAIDGVEIRIVIVFALENDANILDTALPRNE